jgi:hypothetical protein
MTQNWVEARGGGEGISNYTDKLQMHQYAKNMLMSSLIMKNPSRVVQRKLGQLFAGND